MSSSDHNGAHVGLAGGSRPAGDSESGEHNGRDEEKLKGQDLDLLYLGLEGEREKSEEERKNIKDRRRSPDVFTLTHVIVVPGTWQLVCSSALAEVPGTTNPGEMYGWDWLHPPDKLQGSITVYSDLTGIYSVVYF